jgi:hypothetical protein
MPRLTLIVLGLIAAIAAGGVRTHAQVRPTRVEIWDLKLGTLIGALSDDFTD